MTQPPAKSLPRGHLRAQVGVSLIYVNQRTLRLHSPTGATQLPRLPIPF